MSPADRLKSCDNYSYIPHALTFSKSAFYTDGLHIILNANRHYFLKQHQLSELCNGEVFRFH
jgi:hypothetical protein